MEHGWNYWDSVGGATRDSKGQVRWNILRIGEMAAGNRMEPQSLTLRFLWSGNMEVPERGRLRTE